MRREIRERMQAAGKGDIELAKDQKTLRRMYSKNSKKEIADFTKVRASTSLAGQVLHIPRIAGATIKSLTC